MENAIKTNLSEKDQVIAKTRLNVPEEHRHGLYANDLLIDFPPIERLAGQAPKEEFDKLQDEFHALLKKWRKDTQHFSSVTKMIQHPAYRRIVDMGIDVLPYLFNELNQHPDHWLVALNAITGEDPAPENSTFDEAVQAWLAWGRGKGYLQ